MRSSAAAIKQQVMNARPLAAVTWLPFNIIFPLLNFLLLFSLLACTGTQTESSTTTIGETTSIVVAPEFEAFYNEFGGRRVFGDPITAAFRLDEDEPLVQYFHTMRLQTEDGSSSPPSEMQIYPLGEWALAGVGERIPAPVPENGRSRHFPETDFEVRDQFLAFYESYRGEQLLGPPISSQLNEGGLRVQYFRNGRLEWHPQLPIGQRVQVSYLGQAHFEAEMATVVRQRLLARPVPSVSVTSADVFASVRTPVLFSGEEQDVYVTVLTPDGRPVSGLDVQLTITYDGVNRTTDLGQTDEQGKIGASLELANVPPGELVQLLISVYAGNENAVGSTVLTFKTWW
jgi:hypothetical protein